MARPTMAQIARRRGSPLTTKQEQIAFMAGRGMTDAKIARALGRSESTVRQYRTRIYRALKIDNGRALAAWCRKERRSTRRLNQRQLELVGLACLGKRNKEIAASLAMTEGAVKAALCRVCRHVGVANTRGLASLALEGGIEGCSKP